LRNPLIERVADADWSGDRSNRCLRPGSALDFGVVSRWRASIAFCRTAVKAARQQITRGGGTAAPDLDRAGRHRIRRHSSFVAREWHAEDDA
jgi:hypothetical protein